MTCTRLTTAEEACRGLFFSFKAVSLQQSTSQSRGHSQRLQPWRRYSGLHHQVSWPRRWGSGRVSGRQGGTTTLNSQLSPGLKLQNPSASSSCQGTAPSKRRGGHPSGIGRSECSGGVSVDSHQGFWRVLLEGPVVARVRGHDSLKWRPSEPQSPVTP